MPDDNVTQQLILETHVARIQMAVQRLSGVECIDVPAPGVGAMCGPCETAFTGDGEKCAGNKH